MSYNVFTRTFWRANPKWPDGREPHRGKRTYLARSVSREESLTICKEWNASHNPGKLSRKAEFEED
jgi:hypothetical protein